MDSLRMGVNVPKIYFCVIKNGAYGIRTRKIQRFYAVCRLRVAFRVAYFRRWYNIYRSVSVKIWRFYIELESSMYQIFCAPLS